MGAVRSQEAPPRFLLPHGAHAGEPPEARGVARDRVRLAVATPAGVAHARADALPDHLHPGDVMVVNTSATLPAAVDLAGSGDPGSVHVSAELDDGTWVIEPRRRDQRGPSGARPGDLLTLPGGLALRIWDPHPRDQRRLWRASPSPAVDRVAYLHAHGRPIRYPYLREPWPLESLQNAFAAHPGSAEMPSAGRSLTPELLARLVARGVVVLPVLLHTGVSSQEVGEPPQPEPLTVPEATARIVTSSRAAGRRVVAVGTTVVRALESAAATSGDTMRVVPTSGWTSLLLGPDHPARVVTGLLTGLHEPEASHLGVLEAVAGRELVDRAYAAVTAPDAPPYRWHEFGDAMLLLPSPR